MIEASSVHSTPRAAAPPPSTDDALGMQWWNSLSEQDRRRWMRIAGDTGRAVDAWNAFKRAQGQPTGRDVDPKDVLADLFGEELPLADHQQMAEIVIERLRDAGFAIWPFERPAEPPQKP